MYKWIYKNGLAVNVHSIKTKIHRAVYNFDVLNSNSITNICKDIMGNKFATSYQSIQPEELNVDSLCSIPYWLVLDVFHWLGYWNTSKHYTDVYTTFSNSHLDFAMQILSLMRIAVPNSLQWHHNGRNGSSNHQPHHCLFNRLFRHRWKKTSKICVTGLCAGNSPVTGELPTQIASNVVHVSIWWTHHVP